VYWTLKILALALSLLSPAAVNAAAWGIAVLLFDGLRFRRGLIVANIGVAFPEMPPAERVRTGRASVANFVLTALEFLRSVRHDIAAETELVGAEHMHAALAKGGGAYVLCCHLGSWEAMGAKVTRAVAPAHVLVKKVGGRGTDRFVTELRLRNGFLPVMRKEKGDGMRAIVKALKRHEIVGFVMDQARPGEPRLPFFGHPAKTNTSFAAIWLKVPAPIVPAYARRVGVGRHVVEFLPELALPAAAETADGAQLERDVLALSQQFNGAVEAMVRRNPSQYFWLHNRWK
jgi:KDO2-lipid IV(A) lauroyltransferase